MLVIEPVHVIAICGATFIIKHKRHGLYAQIFANAIGCYVYGR